MYRFVLLMRPQQWVKNLFVFLPLFFDRKLLDTACLVPTVIVFAAFCLLSSAVYCFNDIRDVEADRLHPHKCKRPVASGDVSIAQAYVVMAVCLVGGGILLAMLNHTVCCLGAVYVVLNWLYCIRLKQIALIDTFIVAVGFVIRIFAGGGASGSYISHWIVMMTFLLALFLALAKRRDDVVIYDETGVLTRKHIVSYNIAFLDTALAIISTVIVICYIMYTVSAEVVERIGSRYLYTTSAIVLLGVLRYLQLTVVDKCSGSPTRIFYRDRFIQICVALWVIWY
ncbi:MAG: UbiA prenyltransferase family protein, partial [Muribaculaceae bacterium]|nr:UbiA prenyltransferase family protein [Muribaculaceae bacterium]